eukprot:TRINITY_DN83749_c0_g1_i1.p1 TRINITY_DN83749_c0_g1~~TRINITY_DN83749_c0_g1_i1.p1  ORF type:complete len:803 (-),score=136.80 TRINITY_DN83749_c0_g1_i1:11-2398(-)
MEHEIEMRPVLTGTNPGSWSAESVREWLEDQGFHDVARNLASLDGSHLVQLTDGELKALGVNSKTTRRALLRAIHRLVSPEADEGHVGLEAMPDDDDRHALLQLANELAPTSTTPALSVARVTFLVIMFLAAVIAFATAGSSYHFKRIYELGIAEQELAADGLIYALLRGQPLYLNPDKSRSTAYLNLNFFIPTTPAGSWVTIELDRLEANKWLTVTADMVNLTANGETNYHNKLAAFTGEAKAFQADDPELRLAITLQGAAEVAPIKIFYRQQSSLVHLEHFAGAALLGFVYFMLFTQTMDPTVVVLLSSFLGLAGMSLVQERLRISVVLQWIDLELLCMSFGMMVLVAVLTPTRAFEALAVGIVKFTGATMRFRSETRPVGESTLPFQQVSVFRVTVFMCLLVALFSAWIDNVIVMIFVAPLSVRVAKIVGVPLRQLLCVEILFSNIAGAFTAYSHPSNTVLAFSTQAQEKLGSPWKFTGDLAMCVIFVVIVTLLALWAFMRDLRVPVSRRAMLITSKCATYRMAQSALGYNMIEEEELKIELQEKIDNLTSLRDPSVERDVSMETLYSVTDWPRLLLSGGVVAVVLLLYSLHPALSFVNVSFAWVGILGALFVLLLTDPNGAQASFEKVDWNALIFLGGYCVLMNCLSALGVFKFLADLIINVTEAAPPGMWRITLSLSITVWSTALLSGLCDNVVIVRDLMPALLSMTKDYGTGTVPYLPLLYAVALGVNFGSNLTLTGGYANIITAGVANKYGFAITFRQFLKIGIPVTILTAALANGYAMILWQVLKKE